ncbi:hypothetical protein [Kordia sp.]|uniref:hypothetical protein n=1 Tax=Kordia sp. TaxID=1965332 RepID=UPI0025B7FF81|nr:hypothetical protein [Kordia sp.]MCH2195161.1 hypothetical protein [Kordia sp.]
MKKRNIELKKLKLSKTRIASLKQSQQVNGGNNTFEACPLSFMNCPDPPSPTEGACPTGPTGCLCPSQPPICAPTQQDCLTLQNCVTQHSCGGNFLCDNQIPSGIL